MKNIKLFIASSEELAPERKYFSMLANNMNIFLKPEGIKIQLEKWEYFNASMEILHKQKEYNEILKQCDMCIVLFWTKFGDYTKEERDIAQQEYTFGNTLKNVHIYCKEDFTQCPITHELANFKQDCLSQGITLYPFLNNEQLTYHFITHINDYCEKHLNTSIARIEDNKLMIEHKVFADMGKISS